MPKKVQVTLTGNESKRLIAQAAIRVPKIQNCLMQMGMKYQLMTLNKAVKLQ